MFNFTTGNILNSSADALVNTVNCEGYMGKGIAYQFKVKFPHNNDEYVKACRNGKFKIGEILITREEQKTILNFPTKDKWREKSRYEYIEKGMDKLQEILPAIKVHSIAIPPLGCGNGGLEWVKVKEIIIEHLSAIENHFEFEIYEPSKYFSTTEVKEAPKLNTSHLLLMAIKRKLDIFTRIRLQKTAYLMTYLANDEFFKFDAYNFGPYAHSIDILSREIREFQKYYGVDTKGAMEIVGKMIVSDTVKKKVDYYSPFLQQAIEIVNSIHTANELELLTTILYLINKKGPLTKEALLDEVKKWSSYKAAKFSEHSLKQGVEKLKKLDLIDEGLIGLLPKRE
jgi:O-acetyl-ADP-ribose deacetylase (regulator of RNase III)